MKDNEEYMKYVRDVIEEVMQTFHKEEWAWSIILDKTLRPKFYFEKETEPLEVSFEEGTTRMEREELLSRIGDIVENRKFRDKGDFRAWADKLREIFGKHASPYEAWKSLEDPEDLADVEHFLRERNYLD